MSRLSFFTALCMSVLSCAVYGQGVKTVLSVHLNGAKRDSLTLEMRNLYDFDSAFSKVGFSSAEPGRLKWRAGVSQPMLLKASFLKNDEIVYFLEPGDSIDVDLQAKRFSGKGAGKWNLMQDMYNCKNELTKPLKKKTQISSLAEYMEWYAYTEKVLSCRQQLMGKYKAEVSTAAQKYIAANILPDPAKDMSTAFFFLKKKIDDSLRLCSIYDSTIDNSIVKRLWTNDPAQPPSNLFSARMQRCIDQYDRSLNFSKRIDTMRPEIYALGLLDFISKEHKGITYDQLYAFFGSYWIEKFGMTAEFKEDFYRYYNKLSSAKYKSWIDKEIAKAEALKVGDAVNPEISFTDAEGKLVTLAQLKGKILVMDFWFTGCVGCKELNPYIEKLHKIYCNNPNVLFLSISVDKDVNSWKTSLQSKKYSYDGAFNVYTGGKGQSHPSMGYFNVVGYPRVMVIDSRGRLAYSNLPDPRRNFQTSKKSIDDLLIEESDGPYVFYKNDTICTYTRSISADTLLAQKSTNRQASLAVQSYIPDEKFYVNLKSKLVPEPDTFPEPSKLFLVSDIEGNLDKFVKLLEANHIIDQHLNWTFSDGHLVLAGDFFDRGTQVTECLWFIYYLEQKAQQAGGYVHFVLGNHEIMNLSGQNSYTRHKYSDIASEIGVRDIKSLYGNNTELGRWLRTKNIIEKIGSSLVVHGGISPEILLNEHDINELNSVARRFYDQSETARQSKDRTVSLLYDDRLSPFWYRQYYNREKTVMYEDGRVVVLKKASVDLIDSTLNKYHVDRIFTGHTLNDSKAISAYFDGKVVNLDVLHAEGISQGVLIESGALYRVDDKGVRVLIVPSDKNYAER